MREIDSQDVETSDSSQYSEDDNDSLFFGDIAEDMDDYERTSYAILLILAVGGFAVGALLLQITSTAGIVMREYAGDWAWVLAPTPMLVFGLVSLWQYESNWLQRLGAAALGFALSQYVMMAIGLGVLEV